MADKTPDEADAELDAAINDLVRRTKHGSTVNPEPYKARVKAAALELSRAKANGP